MAFEVHQLTATFAAGTVAIGTTLQFVGKAPTDATGGGITVTGVFAVGDTTNAAGSAPQFRLLKYSAGSVSGTIVATQIPGTAALTANTPVSATIANGWVDGGEYIVAERGGTAVSATIAAQKLLIQYVMGR